MEELWCKKASSRVIGKIVSFTELAFKYMMAFRAAELLPRQIVLWLSSTFSYSRLLKAESYGRAARYLVVGLL